jgi:hypothetical protein
VIPLDFARIYLGRGWAPIPVPFREKAPTLTGWQRLRITDERALAAYFNGDAQNVSVLDGEPSGWLIDADLDAAEALRLAPVFLPPTPCRFGRESRRASHWLYVATTPLKTKKFRDPEAGDEDGNTGMLVELRSSGCQTLFPGSTHPSGELVTWDEDGDPAPIDGATLTERAAHLAVACLLARYWPRRGARHDVALAAAGLFAHGGVAEDDAIRIVTAAARDGGETDHEADVRDTFARHRQGVAVTGGPSLADLLRGDGAKLVRRIREWLGLRPAPVDGASRIGVTGADDPRPLFAADAADLKLLMPEVLRAVQAWNGRGSTPHIYNLDGKPVRLDWNAAGDPTLVPLAPEHYLVLLAEAARWDKRGRTRQEGRVNAVPPRHVIDALRAAPATVWPPLRRFVAAPYFRPDGTLVRMAGYDPATGWYSVWQADLQVPPIPTEPSELAIDLAVMHLTDEMLGDFRWRNAKVDLANALALMLTPFVRPFYQGNTPLGAISKTVGRAGAGLLLDTLLFPSLGRVLPRTSLPERAEEVRKSLFALARERDEAILFDNVDGALDQSPLAAFLTSSRLRDRILGVSQAATVAELPLLYVTGVGIVVSSEIGPRVLLIELDPRTERPEERTDFRHAPLRAWLAAERGRLLGACLTLVQAAIAQGWPLPATRPALGDFQEWADRIASVLHVAGITGFLGNRQRLRQADPIGEGWRLLFARYRDAFPPTLDPTTGVTATPVFTAGILWPFTGWKIAEPERLPGGVTIPDPEIPRPRGVPDVPLPLGFRDGGTDKPRQTAFGIALRRRVGQIVDGWRLVTVGDDGHRARAYCLTDRTTDDAEADDDAS